MLDVPAELLRYLSRLLAAERRRRGTPARSRKLTCRDQALLALRWFRDRTRPERLGRDHGISRATAYRYVAEAVDVLSAQAPGLDEALERALADGAPYVILDGKIFAGRPLAETVTSARARRSTPGTPGRNTARRERAKPSCAPTASRCLGRPGGTGLVHDITAAAPDALPALYRAAAAGMPTLADGGYEGAGIGICVPVKNPPGNQRARPRHPNPQQPAARPPQPGRTRIRPAHPALDHPPAHHRQPQKNHPDSPRRPRPHPIRAQVHQLKIGEITSLVTGKRREGDLLIIYVARHAGVIMPMLTPRGPVLTSRTSGGRTGRSRSDASV